MFYFHLKLNDLKLEKKPYLLVFSGECEVLDNCQPPVVHSGSLEVENNYLGEETQQVQTVRFKEKMRIGR